MNSILSVLNLKEDSIIKIGAWLIAISSITGGILLPQQFYFAALALIGIIIFSRGGWHVSNIWVLLFLLVCILSLVVNNPPSFFRAWNRLGVYSLVLLVVSPLFDSLVATRVRYRLFIYFIYIGVILSVGSFFAFFLGINLFERNGEYLEIGAGTFSGLMNHSMVLGPISALSAICVFVKVLNPGNLELSTRKKHLLIAVMVCCCGACLLAASRSALGGLMVGLTLVLVRTYKHRISRTMGTIAVIAILGGATFPIWGGLLTFVNQKQTSNVESGGAFFSREERFSARIYEFKSSPIIGIGFSTADTQFLGVDMETGRVEPGSSWLAILSMTGILGLLCFLPICFGAVKRVWKIRDPFVSCLLCSFLSFFFIHMIAEGYIFAPKSCFILLLWLIFSCINGIATIEKNTSKA